MHEQVKNGMPLAIFEWLQNYSDHEGGELILNAFGWFMCEYESSTMVTPGQVAELYQLHNPEAITVADYEEVLNDHKRLVKELDQIINGPNTAVQASLCDIVSQIRDEWPKYRQVDAESAQIGMPGMWLTVMPSTDGLEERDYFSTYHYAGWKSAVMGVLHVAKHNMTFSTMGSEIEFPRPCSNLSGLKVVIESSPIQAISSNLPNLMDSIEQAKHKKWNDRLREEKKIKMETAPTFTEWLGSEGWQYYVGWGWLNKGSDYVFYHTTEDLYKDYRVYYPVG